MPEPTKSKSPWRLAARNTHLYPGARLRCFDESLRERVRAGDRVLLEFADQGLANGEVVEVLPTGWQLRLDAHSTAKGTAIEAKRWMVQWMPRTEPAAGTMKIRSRVS